MIRSSVHIVTMPFILFVIAMNFMFGMSDKVFYFLNAIIFFYKNPPRKPSVL